MTKYLVRVLVVDLVRSQDDDEESTTVPLSSTTDTGDEQSGGRVVPIVPSRALNMSNHSATSEQNHTETVFNESSKQRIIIALAVLSAALTVLLGFLVSIVVCQWFQHGGDEPLSNGISQTRADLMGPAYYSHDRAYRQTVKL